MACSQYVGDSYFRSACAKPEVVKGLCKFHLGVQQRREKRTAAWEAEWKAKADADKDFSAEVAQFRKATGLEVLVASVAERTVRVSLDALQAKLR